MSTKGKSEDSAWKGGNIFCPMKIFMSVEPRGIEGQKIKILYAQNSFYAQFGLTPANMSILFNDLVSDAHSRQDLSVLERNIMTGTAGTEFINLRVRNNDHPLPCHLSFGAGGVARALTSSGEEIVNRFLVMTIRSASVVGNASVIGMMLTHPVRQELVNARVGVGLDARPLNSGGEAQPAIAKDPALEAETDDNGTPERSKGDASSA